MNFLEHCRYYLMPCKLWSFKRKVALDFKVGKYTVRTASTPKDLYKAMRLRYKVFYQKYQGKIWALGLDTTPFDLDADHLIVCNEKDVVVGTYRLKSSTFTTNFFSASEFDIGEHATSAEVRVELSRACIDSEHRQGVVIACLWRGINRYAEQVKAAYVFGCVSVPTQSYVGMCSLLRYLQQSGMKEVLDSSITPRVGYATYLGIDRNWSNSYGLEPNIPPLFAAYIKMGAKVYGYPAYDPVFKCFDLFSMLRMSDLEPAFQRRLSQ